MAIVSSRGHHQRASGGGEWEDEGTELYGIRDLEMKDDLGT